jgi:hypothetical protein
MRERGIIFALLAGLGAVTYRSSPQNTAINSANLTPAESTPQPAHSSETEFASTLARFAKTRTFEIRVEANGSCTVAAKPVTASDERRFFFDWVVAIVPDPEHSNLRLSFDRDIEAIQLASARAGYQFERYWLPWRTEATARETSYVIRPESRDTKAEVSGTVITPEKDERERLPGVLLFRNGSGWPLAVFLVTESPTAGIAPEEFRTATCLGKQLAELDGAYDGENLRVIGPAFSGSLEPLSTLLRTHELQSRFRAVKIRTWTTDHLSHKRFRESISKVQNECGEQHYELDFKPLLVDSLPAIGRFSEYVRETWHDNTPIVLLTEEATTFGGLVLRPDFGTDLYRDEDQETLDIKRKLTAGVAHIFTVPFPRNLGLLRNATEKHDHLPAFGDDSRRSDLPRNGLLLSLKQQGRPSLEIPTFSDEQTPLSEESVLFTIGAALKTGVIHYVGILATDPLDTLFLTRYLHSASPNVRVFTLDPDLLFEHGSDISDYSGVMGLSSYPLFPLSQVWSGAHEGTIMFPSNSSEAMYNATMAVLHDLPSNGVGRSIWEQVDRRDMTDPFNGHTGALWLTVASRSGFEPITVLEDPRWDNNRDWHAKEWRAKQYEKKGEDKIPRFGNQPLAPGLSLRPPLPPKYRPSALPLSSTSSYGR